MATLTCPVGFLAHPSLQGQCVPECSVEKGFELGLRNGMPVCIYKAKPEYFYSIGYIPAIPYSGPGLLTLEAIQNHSQESVRAQYGSITRALSAARGELDRALAQIGTQTLLQNAFKTLMETEKTRDTDPQSYEKARFAYYSLEKGEEWASQERTRLATAEANEAAANYNKQYASATDQKNKQQQTLDIIKGVASNVSTLKDNFQYSVGTFAKQIRDLKNQIQLENAKKVEAPSRNWLDILLNILIVLLFVVTVWVLIRKIRSRTYSQQPYFYGR
jgi:hypothetical protein